MKRLHRFLQHALLPPLFGGILMFFVMFFGRNGPTDWAGVPVLFGFVILAAYLMAIIPSLAYAALMEWAFSRGVVGGSGRAVVLSAFLGATVGAIPFLGELFNPHRVFHREDLLMFAMPSAVGFVVGVMVELVVAARARRLVLTSPTSGP